MLLCVFNFCAHFISADWNSYILAIGHLHTIAHIRLKGKWIPVFLPFGHSSVVCRLLNHFAQCFYALSTLLSLSFDDFVWTRAVKWNKQRTPNIRTNTHNKWHQWTKTQLVASICLYVSVSELNGNIRTTKIQWVRIWVNPQHKYSDNAVLVQYIQSIDSLCSCVHIWSVQQSAARHKPAASTYIFTYINTQTHTH